MKEFQSSMKEEFKQIMMKFSDLRASNERALNMIQKLKITLPDHEEIEVAVNESEGNGDSFVFEAEVHESLTNKLEDSSLQIHQVCVQSAHDKVNSLSKNELSSRSLTNNTVIGAIDAYKEEFHVDSEVFDESPERDGYIPTPDPKPPDECGFLLCISSSCTSITNFYSKIGLIRDVELVFSRMLDRDNVNWNLLISCYVHHGQSERAIHLRRLMSIDDMNDKCERIDVAGKSHDFGPISCPEQPVHPAALSVIPFGKQKHDAGLKYPLNIFRLNIFPANKTKDLQPIDCFVMEEYLLVVLLFLNGCQKDCASYMAGLPVTFQYEHLMAETIFSQLRLRPQPPFKPIYYTLVIIDLCKALPRAFLAVVAGAVRAFLDKIAELEMECRTRLILWFSRHLSNFQVIWLWKEWAYVLNLPKWAPKCVLVQEVLEREVRLSYWDKVKQSIENAFALEEFLPPKGVPNLKNSAEDGAEHALLKGMVKGRNMTHEIISWMDENVLPASGLVIALKVIVQTLLNIGSKSFTHLITVLKRYGQVIAKMCPDQGKQNSLIDKLSSFWKNSDQMIALTIDRMMGYQLISNSVIDEMESFALIFDPGGTKDIILVGVKSVMLHDEGNGELWDLSSNFIFTENDVGKNRALVYVQKQQELNNVVIVSTLTSKLIKEQLSDFQAVVFIDIDLENAIAFNDYFHNHQPPIAFIKTEVRGLFGNVFCDFGLEFIVFDVDGGEPHTGIIASISNDKPALVSCVYDERLEFQDGDLVVFSEVRGMTEFNDGKLRKVINAMPSSFSLENDTSNLGSYERGGIVNQVKQPKVLNFRPLKDALKDLANLLLSDSSKFDRSPLLHFVFHELDRFLSGLGWFPVAGSEEDEQKAHIHCQQHQR